METKSSTKDEDIEIQVGSASTDDESTQDSKTGNALIDDWDAPDNQENPRNWTACELNAIPLPLS